VKTASADVAEGHFVGIARVADRIFAKAEAMASRHTSYVVHLPALLPS
jgi:hypothetical protein